MAEMLLSYVLSLKRIELYTNFDKIVPKDKLDILHGLVKRAAENEPVAYLIGRTEFYSLELEVNRDCLIPRPETELLVEKAIEFLRKRTGSQLVCDLCTGSGCIAIAIAKGCPNCRVIATDICDKALVPAANNVKKYKFEDRITLLSGDLFDPIIPQLDIEKFDLIVSNPPYVSTSEYQSLDKNVKDFEPKTALLAGVEGLDVYKRIVDKVGDFLKPDAALLMEIGYRQGPAVKSLLENSKLFADIKILRDFHNNDRIAAAYMSYPQANPTLID